MIKKIAMGLVAAVILLCGLGAILSLGKDDEVTRLEPSPTFSTAQRAIAPPSSPASKPPAAAAVKINGDDIVEVGNDVPAGTYRVKSAIEQGSLCYWSKSSDPEGSNIIDNDIPSGGRPQVTLKKGQWFKSSGCPDWVKK